MNSPEKITVEGKNAWCTCKLSKNYPHCDGSHQTTDKKPIVETLDAPTDKYICKCGNTGNAPFCDGSHNNETKTNE